MEKLSDAELRAKTGEFRARVRDRIARRRIDDRARDRAAARFHRARRRVPAPPA